MVDDENGSISPSVHAEAQLAALRQRIDDLDGQMLALLEQRFVLSTKISKAKSAGSAVFRPGREAELIGRLISASEELSDQFIMSLWRVVMSASIALQKPDFTIGCSDAAALTATELSAGQFPVLPSVSNAQAAIDALKDGQADIVMISSDELKDIAASLGRNKGAVIISGTPVVNAHHKAKEGVIIGPNLADRSVCDKAFYYNPHTKEIVTTMLSGYEDKLEDDTDQLFCIGFRAMISASRSDKT